MTVPTVHGVGGSVSARLTRRHRTAAPAGPALSDGELVNAAVAGDRGAFAEIYDRYANRLYDFCLGLISDRDGAADCVQDTFCSATGDLKDLREPDKLRPWLYSIARHHAMRRLRHRYREQVSDTMPDVESHEAGPDTVASQSELARLVTDAAGGLSERDRELLELSYRHGLDGPELSEVLGVSLSNANTMVFRLRQTIERSLGALLVARGACVGHSDCPELTALVKDWDGLFTVLMRKRLSRHIESCPSCTLEQIRQVNPVALLGAAPAFIPAPEWLRNQTLDRVALVSTSSGIPVGGPPRRVGMGITAIVGLPLLGVGAAMIWLARPEAPIAPLVGTATNPPTTSPSLSERPVPPSGKTSLPRASGIISSPATTASPAPSRTDAGPTSSQSAVTTPAPSSLPSTSVPSTPPPPSAPPPSAPPPSAPPPSAGPPMPPSSAGPPAAEPPPPRPPAADPPPKPNVTPPWPQTDTGPEANPHVTPPWPQTETGPEAIELPLELPELIITTIPLIPLSPPLTE